MRATRLLPLFLLGAGPLAAQEPPSHFPTCTTDQLAGDFVARVRYLLEHADTTRRARLHLAPTPADLVRLVTEEPVCLAASYAYARVARGGAALTPPVPVAVVRAGAHYLVQLGGLQGAEAEAWDLAVFDSTFRLVGIDRRP